MSSTAQSIKNARNDRLNRMRLGDKLQRESYLNRQIAKYDMVRRNTGGTLANVKPVGRAGTTLGESHPENLHQEARRRARIDPRAKARMSVNPFATAQPIHEIDPIRDAAKIGFVSAHRTRTEEAIVGNPLVNTKVNYRPFESLFSGSAFVTADRHQEPSQVTKKGYSGVVTKYVPGSSRPVLRSGAATAFFTPPAGVR